MKDEEKGFVVPIFDREPKEIVGQIAKEAWEEALDPKWRLYVGFLLGRIYRLEEEAERKKP